VAALGLEDGAVLAGGPGWYLVDHPDEGLCLVPMAGGTTCGPRPIVFGGSAVFGVAPGCVAEIELAVQGQPVRTPTVDTAVGRAFVVAFDGGVPPGELRAYGDDGDLVSTIDLPAEGPATWPTPIC
jgi:hypothetical protein